MGSLEGPPKAEPIEEVVVDKIVDKLVYPDGTWYRLKRVGNLFSVQVMRDGKIVTEVENMVQIGIERITQLLIDGTRL